MRFAKTNSAAVSLLVMLLPGACCNSIAGETKTSQRTWIAANALGTYRCPANLKEELDLTPSVSSEVTNAWWYNNGALKVKLRSRERLLMLGDANRTSGGRLVIDYDLRSAELHPEGDTNTAAIKHSWAKGTIPLLKASYSRGRVYYSKSDHVEWASLFSSDDNRRVVIVHDEGPIYYIDTSDANWHEIRDAGDYEFTLCTSPKGSELVAVITYSNRVQAAMSEASLAPKREWYAVVPTAAGAEMVLTGGPHGNAPPLTISRSSNTVRLSWPSAFATHVLQSSSDIVAPAWVRVTNQMEVIGTQCVVALPVVEGNIFFRLVSP